MGHYESVPVAASPAAVVVALRETLRQRKITEYAVVDHGHDMDAVGVPGIVASTIVFGNPAAGAKLLSIDPRAAVDLPLRLAVVAGESGSTIVLRDMRSLLVPEAAGLADAFTTVLRDLAEHARALAESV